MRISQASANVSSPQVKFGQVIVEARKAARLTQKAMVVFGEADLRRVPKAYASYYNRIRTHLSLDKDAPLGRRRQTVGTIVSIPILAGCIVNIFGSRLSARTG